MQRLKNIENRRRALLAAGLVLAAVGGCGGDDSEASASDGGDSDAGTSEAGTSDAGNAPDSLYAMMVQVYDQDDRTVYVHLTKTLDLNDELDLGKAREFPGVANLAPVGGRLLISSGIAPKITEYEISDDLKWKEGETISFAGYPFEDNANFYYQYILDEHTAYMPFEVTKRLIWDPTTMEILETLEDSKVKLEQDGLLARSGGNRNAIHYDGPVQQPFFYTDEDWFDIGPESVVTLYDEKSHKEEKRVALPCPGLSMASQDEDGYTYYGTWDFPTRALFGEGPKPCIARLTPEGALDEEWTTDLRDLTDGRYHNNFRYIGGGKAIANVLYQEEIEADWDEGYDADVADLVAESGDHWRLWLFDLEKWEGQPVKDVKVDIGKGAQFAVLEGRTFIFLRYDDGGRSKIYELGDDGRVTERSDTIGDVFKWVKIR